MTNEDVAYGTFWSPYDEAIDETMGDVTHSGDNGGYVGGIIGIGTDGDVGITRSDYDLNDVVDEDYCVASYASGNVSMSVSFYNDWEETKNIDEAGFMCEWTLWDDDVEEYVSYPVLLFHDNFTAIEVEEEEYLVVTYYLSLDQTGFTNNFGEFLAAIFHPCAYDSSRTVLLQNKVGNSYNMAIYNVTSLDGYSYFGSSVPDAEYPHVFISVGTGATATSRSSYKLQTETATYGRAATVYDIEADYYTSWLASLQVSSTSTITEAGLFRIFTAIISNHAYSDEVMMWRCTFAGVNVPSGQNINIRFYIEY
jgi:hypothetical protein